MDVPLGAILEKEEDGHVTSVKYFNSYLNKSIMPQADNDNTRQMINVNHVGHGGKALEEVLSKVDLDKVMSASRLDTKHKMLFISDVEFAEFTMEDALLGAGNSVRFIGDT